MFSKFSDWIFLINQLCHPDHLVQMIQDRQTDDASRPVARLLIHLYVKPRILFWGVGNADVFSCIQTTIKETYCSRWMSLLGNVLPDKRRQSSKQFSFEPRDQRCRYRTGSAGLLQLLSKWLNLRLQTRTASAIGWFQRIGSMDSLVCTKHVIYLIRQWRRTAWAPNTGERLEFLLPSVPPGTRIHGQHKSVVRRWPIFCGTGLPDPVQWQYLEPATGTFHRLPFPPFCLDVCSWFDDQGAFLSGQPHRWRLAIYSGSADDQDQRCPWQRWLQIKTEQRGFFSTSNGRLSLDVTPSLGSLTSSELALDWP